MPGGKNIHHQSKAKGYTIIEVMIVLAVSGVMFVIAANFINGKQERTAFTQGVNETSSRIQDVIEQVVDGRFSDIPLGCSSSGGGATTITQGESNDTQGTNSSCVFLGKMMHFKDDGKDTKYSIKTLAGARLVAGAQPNLSNVNPTVVGDLTIKQTIPQSLSMTSLKIDGVTKTADFGFVQGLGTVNDDFSGYKSGAQNIKLVYTSGEDINSINYAKSAMLCITDDTQYAELTVGASGNELGVSVKRLGTTAC